MSDGPARPPLFLERRSYRRRRLGDAARVLPIAGLFLFVLPILWQQAPDAAGSTVVTTADADGTSTAAAGLYLFAVWGALILSGALLSRALMRPEPPAATAAPDASDRETRV